MKFASFLNRDVPSWGLVEDDYVLDVGAVMRSTVESLRQAIGAGLLADAVFARKTAERLPLATLTMLPVIPDPSKILCVGLNYDSHRRETGRPVTGHPTIFTRFANTLVAHGGKVVRPRVSTKLDYEGELAVVIGQGGRYIQREEALRHVAGYTCHNDATLRDWQGHTSQFTPGKNFPGTGPLGPFLVTPDEIPCLEDVTIETRLNGLVVQSASVGQMIFPVADLIEYISTFTPLVPGDIIASGTPGGVGSRREPPLFMKAGDRIEVDIGGVGLLSNEVADETESSAR